MAAADLVMTIGIGLLKKFDWVELERTDVSARFYQLIQYVLDGDPPLG